MLHCDFCNIPDPDPVRRYACQTFVAQAFPFFESVTDWAACTRCAALIDADKWDELLDVSVNAEPMLDDAPDYIKILWRKLMMSFHEQFRTMRMQAH